MKKILAIMGSPRKNGNTHILIQRILEGAQSTGNGTELLFLRDLNIKECDGCFSCWKTDRCTKKDDMIPLYQKILDSDVLIFGSPIYWYGITGILKIFLDRFVFFNSPENKGRLIGKEGIIVLPFEENDRKTAEPAIQMLEKSFNYLQIPITAKLIVPGVFEKGDVNKKKEVLINAFELGEKISEKSDQ